MSDSGLDGEIRKILESSSGLPGERKVIYAQPEQIGLHNFDTDTVYVSVNLITGFAKREDVVIWVDAFSCFESVNKRMKAMLLRKHTFFSASFTFSSYNFSAYNAASEISGAYKEKTCATLGIDKLQENLQAGYDALQGRF